MLDFATQIPGHDLYHAVEEAEERWAGNAFTDYAYHPILTHGAGIDSIRQIPELVTEGIASFKIFTTSIRPPSPQMQNNHTDFGRLSEIMDQVQEAGGVVGIEGRSWEKTVPCQLEVAAACDHSSADIIAVAPDFDTGQARTLTAIVILAALPFGIETLVDFNFDRFLRLLLVANEVDDIAFFTQR